SPPRPSSSRFPTRRSSDLAESRKGFESRNSFIHRGEFKNFESCYHFLGLGERPIREVEFAVAEAQRPRGGGGLQAIASNACTFRSEEHTSELQSRENLVCR